MSDEMTKEQDVAAEKEGKTVSKTATASDKDGAEKSVRVAKTRKSGKRQIRKGQAHIQSTYNNTIVTITDLNGAVLGWSSAGTLGFKGAKKSTPYAASQIVNMVVEKVQKNNIKELQIFVKGVGGGRDAAIRALAA
ncbi:MAG: 30S ribosomal protein S11, partial [Patescibacteria group bacterium]|nr:30S ribosomal protein S11 [Patescibacteria group bacterium]